MSTWFNQYEQAFECWLIDNRLQYVTVDQHKRKIFARDKIKSFDFLLYPSGSEPIIAEVKGRKFRGTNLARLKGLDCWVTMDDIRGLIRWEQIFSRSSTKRTRNHRPTEAVFIFVYKFENIDVETDGREVYDFAENQYMFYAVRLDDYRTFMTVRSPKWQTVTLPAAKFAEFAVPVRQLLLGEFYGFSKQEMINNE